ncbi:MAG: amidohydrolase family protein [Phycisphaerales bacterium]|nr:MAG: amidohydrolase family protein [Phycisphaerales bacterium]
MKTARTLLRAAMIADGDAVWAAPGAVLVESGRILASGSPQSIGTPSDTEAVDLPRSVLIPALVNVHSHLDLTHVRPVPFSDDFRSWADYVRTERAVEDDRIAAAVRRGIELSRLGGTAIIGDIAGNGSLIPLRELRAAGLAGVSFLEVFGTGQREEKAIGRLRHAVETCSDDDSNARLGLQPHAAYSCGESVYFAAASLGRPVSTHLAETLEELEFVARGTGPLADLLKDLGVWDGTVTAPQVHPIDWLAQALAATPFVAAHLNYVEPRHLGWLAAWNTTVAYCPRASTYFGHPQGGNPPHLYRQMLDAGVNVALGTDSSICLDTPGRISVLDEMRLLHRRDGTEPRKLLAMATTAGARGLGFDARLTTLAPGPTAGILAVPCTSTASDDPLADALNGDDPPRWVWGPIDGREFEDE